MKYSHARNTASHFVTFPGFSIEVSTEGGAAKLVGELNGLNEQIVEQGKILDQLKRENEVLALDLSGSRERTSDLVRQNSELRALANEYGGALDDCQQALAEYLPGRPSYKKMKQVITDLLAILDQGELVKSMRHNGVLTTHKKVRGTKAQILAIDESCAGRGSPGDKDGVLFDGLHPTAGVEAPGTIYAAEIGEAMPPAVTYATVNNFAPVLKRKDRAAIAAMIEYVDSDTAEPGEVNRSIKRLKKLLKRF